MTTFDIILLVGFVIIVLVSEWYTRKLEKKDKKDNE
jgi:hypothetical protein